jgi:hypothetical protein
MLAKMWLGLGVLRQGQGKLCRSGLALKEGKDKMIFVVTPLNLLGKQNEIRHIVLQFNTYETDMGGHFLTLE